MESEFEAPRRNRSQRPVLVVLIVLAVVAIALFARLAAPEDDTVDGTSEDQLEVADADGASPSPTLTREPAGTEPTRPGEHTPEVPGRSENSPDGLADWPPRPATLAGLRGLQYRVPLTRGEWSRANPPLPAGQTAGGSPPTFVWDGREVLAIGRSAGTAYDPENGTWRPLPDVPADRSLTGQREAIVVDGQVVVVDTEWPESPEMFPDPGTPTGAWVLQEDWTPVDPPPPGRLLGTVDDAVLVAEETAVNPGEPITQTLTRWTPGGPTRVVDMPGNEIVVDTMVDTSQGFIVMGRPLTEPADGLVVMSFSEDGSWRRLSDAPVFSSAEGALWLPGPSPEGRLVLAGGLRGGRAAAFAILNLDGVAHWATVPIPLEPGTLNAQEVPSMALTWDGHDTVYAYGIAPSTIFVALGLASRQVSAALPQGRSVFGQLSWTGNHLLLTGGFGSFGPAEDIRVWTPIGETMNPLDPDRPDLSGCMSVNPHLRRGDVDVPVGVGIQEAIEEGLRDGWELASGLLQVLAYDQGIDGNYYTAAVVRDNNGIDDVGVWVSPDRDATVISDTTDPASVYLYAAGDVAAAAAKWLPDREPGYAENVSPITETLARCLPPSTR